MSELSHFKCKYLLESVFYNRGMINLITIGIFSLLFFPDKDYLEFYREFYKIFYALLIGVGCSGIFCWILAFKIFNQKFNLYYCLWLFCYLVEVLFYLFILIQIANSQFSINSILAMVMGLTLPLIIIESLLNFRYRSLFLIPLADPHRS